MAQKYPGQLIQRYVTRSGSEVLCPTCAKTSALSTEYTHRLFWRF